MKIADQVLDDVPIVVGPSQKNEQFEMNHEQAYNSSAFMTIVISIF